MEAEGIKIRDRRYGEAVFTSFKDVVISRARVFVTGRSIADFLSWVKDPELYFLAGMVLARPTDQQDISLLASRLVFEGLEIYEVTEGRSPRLVISAECMVKEALSHENAFTGRLMMEISPSQRITSSREARWTGEAMYFPNGCSVNDEYTESTCLATGNTGVQLIAAADLAEALKMPAPSPAGASIDRDELRSLLRKKDRKGLKRLFLQYLVLNPDAMRNLAPMMVMGSGFKLGQFKPEFALKGSRADQRQISPALNRHTNTDYEPQQGLLDKMLDHFLGS
ncbi:MAG: hypothetical protein AB9866_23490 [Syntrophobacteraceae bacterium]